MSDTFWMCFFGVVTLIVKDQLDAFRQRRLAKQNLELATELHENTRQTIVGNKEVSDKLDSAEVRVKTAVVDTGESVRKEAVKTAQAGAVIALQTANKAKESSAQILEQLVPIADKLNGGPNGLTTLTERVSVIEGRMDVFLVGQTDIVKSIDHLANMIDRKQV